MIKDRKNSTASACNTTKYRNKVKTQLWVKPRAKYEKKYAENIGIYAHLDNIRHLAAG